MNWSTLLGGFACLIPLPTVGGNGGGDTSFIHEAKQQGEAVTAAAEIEDTGLPWTQARLFQPTCKILLTNVLDGLLTGSLTNIRCT